MLQSRRELSIRDWGRQMMSHRILAILTLAAVAALGGCSSSGTLSRYTHDTPQAAEQAAGLYLDGTGPAAEEAETRRQARRPAPATPRAARAEDLSARTTGSRVQASSEPLKPYSDEWWEKEKREDARLKQKMNICKGC